MALAALPSLSLAVPSINRHEAQHTLTQVRSEHTAAEYPGWEYVENTNMPSGRGVPGLCTGKWGFMVFGGELLETENTDETWILSEPGGRWQRMSYRVAPSPRALPAVAPYTNENGVAGCLLFGGVFHDGARTAPTQCFVSTAHIQSSTHTFAPYLIYDRSSLSLSCAGRHVVLEPRRRLGRAHPFAPRIALAALLPHA